MLSSLPCSYAFYWSAISTSRYISNVFFLFLCTVYIPPTLIVNGCWQHQLQSTETLCSSNLRTSSSSVQSYSFSRSDTNWMEMLCNLTYSSIDHLSQITDLSHYSVVYPKSVNPFFLITFLICSKKHLCCPIRLCETSFQYLTASSLSHLDNPIKLHVDDISWLQESFW